MTPDHLDAVEMLFTRRLANDHEPHVSEIGLNLVKEIRRLQKIQPCECGMAPTLTYTKPGTK